MKLKLDHGYMKKIKYITLGFVIIYLIYLLLDNFVVAVDNVKSAFSFVVKVFSPFLWGIVIAYLLMPIVKYFERIFGRIRLSKKWSRAIERRRQKRIRIISLILTLVVIIGIIFFLGYSVFIMINGSVNDFEFNKLFDSISSLAKQYTLEISNIEDILMNFGLPTNILNVLTEFTEDITHSIQSVLTGITSSIATFGRYFIDITFGFVFAFNFILNREYFYNLVENILRLTLNEKRRSSFNEIMEKINAVLLSFLRGKIIDLTLLSFVTVISLVVIGFDYSFIVGTFAGYTNIIPYIGTWIGIVPAVIIALGRDGWQDAVFIGAYIVIVQQIYYIFVSPRIQGKSVGMHPVFILLAIFVFGKFFGLLGMILSIPLAGIVQIFILRWANKRKQVRKIELIPFKKEK